MPPDAHVTVDVAAVNVHTYVSWLTPPAPLDVEIDDATYAPSLPQMSVSDCISASVGVVVTYPVHDAVTVMEWEVDGEPDVGDAVRVRTGA